MRRVTASFFVISALAIGCGGKILEEDALDGGSTDLPVDAGSPGFGVDGSTTKVPPSQPADASITVPPAQPVDAGKHGRRDGGFAFDASAFVDAATAPCLVCAQNACSMQIDACEQSAACSAALAQTETCIAGGGDFMSCAVQAFETNPGAVQTGLQIANCIQTSDCATTCGM